MSWFTPLLTSVAPSMSSVTSVCLGHGSMTPERKALDRIPMTVVEGFRCAAAARDITDLQHRLDDLDPALRGFGYEGATMAYTIVDALAGGNRTRDLLDGPGRAHLLLSYIGIGFAMRRLPRMLWPRVLPDLDAPPYHPALSWLAVDGYGFDLAYFQTHKYVNEQRRPKPWPWLGREDYFAHAVDQGIGRALWFIAGGKPEIAVDLLAGFPADRHADLWSGLGLASTFAGPTADETPYVTLRELSGDHWVDLALGSGLASAARKASGHVPAHSEVASNAFTALDVAEAAVEAEEAAATDDTAEMPAYGRWRSCLTVRLTGVMEPCAS